ncbi:MAG: YggS family pyridoxal phosphate-dependent enzyme [Gammaproteobacteria bacterium]|nr:YggS family pyridoxal phosphate-dependent enzyme [Gammaproteobacteria bacterium]
MTDVTVAVGIIRDRIAAATAKSGREPSAVRLIAVSKTHAPEAIRRVLATGQNEFAENYLQEAVGKIQSMTAEKAIWHYIGRIQSNKTRDIASHFDWVQTVDRSRIVERLAAGRPKDLPPLNICLQLRLSDDPDRPGAAADQLVQLAAQVASHERLRLRGLMCMPPLASEPGALREHFTFTRRCFEELRRAGQDIDTLSMGTTGDFELAIECGATLVRIGTAIFGARRS